MSDTPETDAAELIYDGIVASGYADAEICRKLERERDQARRELDIQLKSIHFHMERVPVKDHPLRADDAPLQDSGAEPQPLREGEPSDFCGAIRRMRDAERERNSLQDQRDFAMGEIERLRKEREEAREALQSVMDWNPKPEYWERPETVARFEADMEKAREVLEETEETKPHQKWWEVLEEAE